MMNSYMPPGAHAAWDAKCDAAAEAERAEEDARNDLRNPRHRPSWDELLEYAGWSEDGLACVIHEQIIEPQLTAQLSEALSERRGSLSADSWPTRRERLEQLAEIACICTWRPTSEADDLLAETILAEREDTIVEAMARRRCE